MISRVLGTVFLASFLTMGSGCYFVVRTAPPPAPAARTKPAKPYPKAVWIPGHYKYTKGRYVWRPGHWSKPHPGRVWVAGRWRKTSRGWVYTKGHWRVR